MADVLHIVDNIRGSACRTLMRGEMTLWASWKLTGNISRLFDLLYSILFSGGSSSGSHWAATCTVRIHFSFGSSPAGNDNIYPRGETTLNRPYCINEPRGSQKCVCVCVCPDFGSSKENWKIYRGTDLESVTYQWKIEVHATKRGITVAPVQSVHQGTVSAWMISHWVIFWEIRWTGRDLFWLVSDFLSVGLITAGRDDTES